MNKESLIYRTRMKRADELVGAILGELLCRLLRANIDVPDIEQETLDLKCDGETLQEFVNLLIGKGAHVDEEWGCTCALELALWGHVENGGRWYGIIELLLTAGADASLVENVNWSEGGALSFAFEDDPQGHPIADWRLFNLLLKAEQEHGDKWEERLPFADFFMFALLHDRRDIAESLLSHGVDVESVKGHIKETFSDDEDRCSKEISRLVDFIETRRNA